MTNTKFLFLAVISIALFSCGSSKQTPPTGTNDMEIEEAIITVKGEVTAITRGKDGYTATIQDAKGDLYDATISKVNLLNTGGTYKSSQVGDRITVTGSSWKDTEGKVHITVSEMGI